LAPALFSQASAGVLPHLCIFQGADVNAVDKQEMTPLHCAVGKAQLKMTKFLINHGAAIEQADIKGKTILHFAVESQKLECLEMLVKNISKVELLAISQLWTITFYKLIQDTQKTVYSCYISLLLYLHLLASKCNKNTN